MLHLRLPEDTPTGPFHVPVVIEPGTRSPQRHGVPRLGPGGEP